MIASPSMRRGKPGSQVLAVPPAVSLVAAPGALGQTGCRGVAPSYPSPPAPAAVVYEAQLVPGDPPEVLVTVRTSGEAEGETAFVLDEESKAANLEKRICDVSATDATGKALAVETGSGLRWVVRHPPGEALVLRYRIGKGNPPRPSEYGPMVTAEFCLLIGGTSLLFPHDPESKTERLRRVTFHWRSFVEAGWTVASSFGLEADLDFTLPAHRFFTTQFLAARRLTMVHREIDGGTVTVAVAGERWKFSPEAVADTAVTVIRTEREFFDDAGPPFFLIGIVPAGSYREGEGTFYASGTGLTNSFALLLPPPAEYPSFQGPIQTLLAHELLHGWIGQTIRSAEKPGAVAWFFEGFTTFYTRRFLHRSGLMSADEYVADLNESIQEYFGLSLRNAPNQRIEQEFFTSREVSRLPYRRGDLVALALDEEIQRQSQGRRSLDDVILSLTRAGREGQQVTTESLLATFTLETSAPFGERLRKMVLDGATVEVPRTVSAPCLTLEPGARCPHLRLADEALCSRRS
jgi:predicted metalloprotease with PDZ domain